MGRLVIYGAGGFGRELLTTARSMRREVVYLSDTPVAAFPGIKIIPMSELTASDEVVIGIADSAIRRRIAEKLDRFATLVAPTAIIGHDVLIGEGAVLCDNVMITACARIGRHFHANIYSYVTHDCVIGDFVTFGPRVSCNGNVVVEDDVYIGGGALIRQGRPGRPVVIGKGATIGMGAVVLGDVPPGATVVGNPARVIRQREVITPQNTSALI